MVKTNATCVFMQITSFLDEQTFVKRKGALFVKNILSKSSPLLNTDNRFFNIEDKRVSLNSCTKA